MVKMVSLEVATGSQTELVDITSQVQKSLDSVDLDSGLLLIYCPHTTGAVTINEGADPAVRKDIMDVLNKVVPWNFDYRHMEGTSTAHITTNGLSKGQPRTRMDGAGPRESQADFLDFNDYLIFYFLLLLIS